MAIKEKRNYAIGVFDSGLGGLTVVKELMRQLPKERIVYFGDTARVPYGTKSKEAVLRFSKENTALLLKHKVKMVVVACNTSSSIALTSLKKKFRVPILGVITPGARAAARATKNKRVGVIATAATIRSNAYVTQIKQHNRGVKVFTRACPLFVPLVEEGWTAKATTRAIAHEYLAPMKRANVDTVILGCTHYPLLKPVIKRVLGPRVMLIDSAREVAVEVKHTLQQNGMCKTAGRPAHTFLVSDEPKHFRTLARRFLGFTITNVKRAKDV